MILEDEENIKAFVKGIRSQDIQKNRKAIAKALELKDSGSEIDFELLIEENQSYFTDYFEEYLVNFPFDEAFYDVHKGGEGALKFMITSFANQRDFQDIENIIDNIDGYFANFNTIEGNKIARQQIGFSKAEYEMYKTLLNEEQFDPLMAMNINAIANYKPESDNQLGFDFDKLSPTYIKAFMHADDVKAIIAQFVADSPQDYNVKALTPEVADFVKSCSPVRSNSSASIANNALNYTMFVAFANGSVSGLSKEDILYSLISSEVVTEKRLERFYKDLEKEQGLKDVVVIDKDEETARLEAEFEEEYLAEIDEDYKPKRGRRMSM